MWFIGVEVEQETSAPPPKKDPGTAPETLLKMRPNYSPSSRENATPSSGTSPLASYKEVPPSPEMTCGFLIQLVFCKKKTMWFIGRDECTPS